MVTEPRRFSQGFMLEAGALVPTMGSAVPRQPETF
jgi:hypothetical protein